MTCAWKELMSVLPSWLAAEVGRINGDALEEIRLRINMPAELMYGKESVWLNRTVTRDDLNFCINAASRYSPWSASTASEGYITAPGGHRIGMCGEAVAKDGQIVTIRNLSSLCIRVAKDFPGIAHKLSSLTGSVLILGAPGWGKTTLLRDLIRQRSDRGEHIAVVDERSELFPDRFPPGKRTDLLTGCRKTQGISMLLRTMGPQCIAVDEITAPEDADGLLSAAWCGVRLLATAHAATLKDFQTRPVYQKLAEAYIFDTIVILHSDKTWHLERSHT